LSAPSRKSLKIASRLLAGLAVITWFFSVGLGLEYDNSRPRAPLPAEGKVYPFANHERVVYLTKGEQYRWKLLVYGAVCLFLGGAALDYFQRRSAN
jgi:hypothetical protein